jgi:hypothetical protein
MINKYEYYMIIVKHPIIRGGQHVKDIFSATKSKH